MPDDPRVLELEGLVRRRTDELAILTRLGVELGSTLDLDRLLATMLASLDEVFGFAHSMVLLRPPDREVLVVAASRGYPDGGVGAEVPLGHGVVGVVARRRKLLRMGGVALQRDYVGAAASTGPPQAGPALPGLPDVASLVAVPLVKGDDLIGVFYVESPAPAVFDDAHQALIEAIAGQAAVAIQNAWLHAADRARMAEVQAANDALTAWNVASQRFVPHEFLSILGHERLPDVRRGDHAELPMSTFFSDIRGYTTLVEGQGARANFAFINEYLAYMEAPIRAQGGFVDSYRGDGIMALFPGSSDTAVTAAVESLRALAHLNDARRSRGDRPLSVGIGIDTGVLMLGTIGGAARLSASVIGDSANTASRIEGLTRRYGAKVLISDRTRDGFATPAGFALREVDCVRPQGKTQAITLYEVLDGLLDEERDGKLASREDFERGLTLYRRGEAGEGLVHFAAALKRYPADRAAQLYVGRCWNFIEHGVPDGWDGVVTLTTK